MSDYNKDVYFVKEFSAWGFGTWKKKWEYINNHVLVKNYPSNILRSTKLLTKLIKNRYRIIGGLLSCLSNNNVIGDIYITAHLHLNNIYCIFPNISKVKNWGHDGTGIHCGTILGENIFLQQKIDEKKDVNYENIIVNEDKKIKSALKKYFNIPLTTKIKIALKLFRHIIINELIIKNKEH